MPNRFVSLLVLASVLLAGCGGGGASSPQPAPQGRASLTVVWPARNTRLIPLTANSLVATLILNGVVVQAQTLARPADGSPATAIFTGLMYGAYTVKVDAYPTGDGLATAPDTVAQAAGRGSMLVTEDVPGTLNVAMASTVAHLALTPTSLVFAKGSGMDVFVSATDTDGSIVPLAANGTVEPIVWSLDATKNVTLATSGLSATLTGGHSGSATLTASMVVDDAGTVVMGTAPVTVTPLDDGTGTVTVH